MTCCNADGLFTMIKTGYDKRNSNGNMFRTSAIKYCIHDIPKPSQLRNDENQRFFSYYLVGDNEFLLSKYLMRPYSQIILDNVKRIFNYRLNRGRKTIECTFAMACKKFAVLNGSICIRDPTNINFVIKAACVLHNYVRKQEGLQYMLTHFADCETNDHNAVPVPRAQYMTINVTSTAAAVRNYLADYILNSLVTSSWQWKYAIG